MRRAAVAAALAAGLFGATTWLALEGRDVAVLRTGAPPGRATRVWVAEADGALWLEAATPERAWYRDVLADPVVALEHEGAARRYHARPEPGPEGHRRIRSLLRAKYGWADAWVGRLQDTSRSIAVRLDPVPEPAAGTF